MLRISSFSRGMFLFTCFQSDWKMKLAIEM